MSKDIKIYIASPLGFSEIGKKFLYGKIIPIIECAGYQVIDPWKLTPDNLIKSVLDLPLGEERKNKFVELDKIIGKNNEQGIRKSTGLFAVLDGVDVDSGVASEIGFAAALEKPILGYRNDFRLASENEGAIVNIQVEYFIKNNGRIITKIDDLGKELKLMFE